MVFVNFRASRSADTKTEDSVQVYQLCPMLLAVTDRQQHASDNDHPRRRPPYCTRCTLIQQDTSAAQFV